MKKFLALTLSLLMALSCMTCLFTGTASAETTAPEDITWQSPASWVSFETLSTTPAVNGPIVRMKSAASQALYTRVNLEANTNYSYTMYVKNLTLSGSYNQFSIVSSFGSDELDFAKLDAGWRDYKVTGTNHVADGAVVAYNSYFKDLGATEVTGADGATWSKINVNFTTSDATQYILVMNSSSLVDSSDNNVYISDVAFEKKILGDWLPARSIGIATTETDGSAIAPYAKGPAYRLNTWLCNNSMYTTAALDANSTYTFTAYFKGPYVPPIGYNANGTATDGKGDNWVVPAVAGFDECLDNNGITQTNGKWHAYYTTEYANLYNPSNASIDPYTDDNTWRKFTFTFTTLDNITQYYIVLGLGYAVSDVGNVDSYISDVSIYKTCSVSATADGNGTARVDNTAPKAGETVTFTAKAINGSTFLGWYNGETKISDQLVYTVTVNNNLALTAKFEGGMEIPTWHTPTTSWASIVPDEGTVYENGPVWHIKAQFQAIYTRISLEPNTTYTYTMYTKGILLEGSYNQFSIVSSLGSDALDFAKLSGEWTEYKPASHLADGAVQIYNSYLKDLGATNVTGADGEPWNKISISFTTGAATQYVVVMNALKPTDEANPALYMSDLSITKQISISATAEGNGTAKVDKATASSGETVTFTAATAGGSTFLGWYNGDTKVSDDLVYTVIAKESLNLVAKFKGGATAIDGWYSPRGGAGWITTTTDIASVAGGTVYKTGSWPVDRSIYTKLTLKPGTTYTFSAYFMGAVAAAVRNNADPNLPALYQDGKGNESWIISANADITKGNAGSSTGISDWNEFTGNGTYANLNKGDGSLDAWDAENKFTTWRKYEVTFKTEEDTEYYIILGLEGDSGEQANYPNYMSDASLIEVGDAVPEVTEFTTNLGSSLRKESESTYGQAIRHKFTLEKEVLTANYDGYKVVEIGFATAVTANLDGHADIPVLNASSYRVLTGVAYKADYSGNVSKNIVYAEDDNYVTYTAALYNISDYAKEYTVVPYVIYENAEGNQVTRYGEGQTASIFDVAKAILDGNNSDDIDYVNGTLLAGDYKAKYDEWLVE